MPSKAIGHDLPGKSPIWWSRPQPVVLDVRASSPSIKPYVRISRIRLPSMFTVQTLNQLAEASAGRFHRSSPWWHRSIALGRGRPCSSEPGAGRPARQPLIDEAIELVQRPAAHATEVVARATDIRIEFAHMASRLNHVCRVFRRSSSRMRRQRLRTDVKVQPLNRQRCVCPRNTKWSSRHGARASCPDAAPNRVSSSAAVGQRERPVWTMR